MPNKRCFVISPVGEEGSPIRRHADQVFGHIIAPALEELGIVPVRSDHMLQPGRISEQVFRAIVETDVCVAVLTFTNPNVFYELAVAQCASRPVVLLLAKGETVPFDIQDLRMLRYDLDLDAITGGEYRDELVRQVTEVLHPSLEPVNPLALVSRHWTPHQLRRMYKLVENSRPSPLPPRVDVRFRLPGDESRSIVVRTGDLSHVRDVDVLVSSENTDFQPARYFESSLSGALRYYDARRDAGGAVIRDSLALALRAEIERLGLRLPALPAAVIVTPADGLRAWGVKHVFHVATVRGEVGHGYVFVSERLEACVANTFERFGQLAAEEPLTSIMFPIFGAGAAGRDALEAVRSMLPHVLDGMRATPACAETHLLARIESHREAIRRAADDLGLEPVT